MYHAVFANIRYAETYFVNVPAHQHLYGAFFVNVGNNVTRFVRIHVKAGFTHIRRNLFLQRYFPAAYGFCIEHCV